MQVNLWFHKLGSPPTFYRFATVLRPWLLVIALVLTAVGLYGGLVLAPPDYQQGDAFRIIYIHVPSAWMSLSVYACMAVAAFVALVWRMKLAEIVTMECAAIGAAFTLITLVTGSLWGKPMWGTWWTWGPRLTSELVLLFVYLAIIGLGRAFEDSRRGARAASFLVLIGVVNLPIIHYSVVWWNSLHQGATVKLMGDTTMPASMLWPLLVMVLAMEFYFGASLLNRARSALLSLERGKQWVRDIATVSAHD